ncbi:MgPME-cyclase complex family protein [Synechococcus sp. MIT S1220]|uniref:MgPME-cyclase complex family protein n=1 Tax=Synechococcus sp. MIT S1220 TaxID=3082549 RepID=UPI0039B071E9
MTQYHFIAASERFLIEEEPLDEVLRERLRNYAENNKTVDFWLVRQPAFLSAPQFAELNQLIPQPTAAVVSSDPSFITFLKLRLEYVVTGQFEAPSAEIPEPLASQL